MNNLNKQQISNNQTFNQDVKKMMVQKRFPWFRFFSQLACTFFFGSTIGLYWQNQKLKNELTANMGIVKAAVLVLESSNDQKKLSETKQNQDEKGNNKK